MDRSAPTRCYSRPSNNPQPLNPIVINLSEFLTIGVTIAQSMVLATFLYALPGWALIQWLWRGEPLFWAERFGLSVCISAAVYPLLFLWFYLLGFQPGALLAWLPGGFAVVALLLKQWRTGKRLTVARLSSQLRDPYTASLTLLLLLTVSTRLASVHTMVAPAWGDSVHHTYIVQLLLDHGGLFRSWQPYAPIQSFTYHFGFHSLVAVWAWLSGASASHAVINAGQMLNVAAVIVVYPVAYRLSGKNRMAAMSAVVVAGLFSEMPAYYVNWGRYTQLAGQISLLGLIWLFDLWWTERCRPPRRLLILITISAAGLILTHYRIALLGAAAGLAWTLWGLWLYRQKMGEWVQRLLWLITAGIIAVGGVVPWLLITRSGRLESVALAVGQLPTDNAPLWADLAQWVNISEYYFPLLWIIALVALAFALYRRPALSVPLLLWGAVTFLLTNPFLLGLPGTGYITNFLLMIAIYIPLAILLGWLLGEIYTLLVTWGRIVQGMAGIFTLILVGMGIYFQLTLVDPFFQMMTRSDESAFAWIEKNTPPDARFLVNAFPAYSTLVVGSDAGWWLPLYTKRASTLPPVIYFAEQLEPSIDRDQFWQTEIELQQSNGDPGTLRAILCAAQITHVFIGQRQGGVGYGDTSPLPPVWFADNPNFSLLHQEDLAQVLAFDTQSCR